MGRAVSELFDAGAIRSAMRQCVHAHDPTAALFDEMPLCRGVGRADLAAVNGSLSGYEIKSGRDSLARLPLQIPTYDTVFDFSAVVVTSRHLRSVRRALPARWGIFLVESQDDRPAIQQVRAARQNRSTDIRAQIRLLWKSEVVKVLRKLGSTLPASVSVLQLWAELDKSDPLTIAQCVRDLLKARAGQVVAQP